jgi:hypothetical protein
LIPKHIIKIQLLIPPTAGLQPLGHLSGNSGNSQKALGNRKYLRK